MKKYLITSRLSNKARKEIERIIATHEKYSKSYFFHSGLNASSRRRNEERFDSENPSVTFVVGSKNIEVTMSYSESCKNVYYRLSVIEIEEGKITKVGNISTLKKLLK